MQHSGSPFGPERSPPTLWPRFPQDDDTRMKLALEACEAENRSLRRLVVNLSEIVLRITGGSQGSRS